MLASRLYPEVGAVGWYPPWAETLRSQHKVIAWGGGSECLVFLHCGWARGPPRGVDRLHAPLAFCFMWFLCCFTVCPQAGHNLLASSRRRHFLNHWVSSWRQFSMSSLPCWVWGSLRFLSLLSKSVQKWQAPQIVLKLFLKRTLHFRAELTKKEKYLHT